MRYNGPKMSKVFAHQEIGDAEVKPRDFPTTVLLGVNLLGSDVGLNTRAMSRS